MENSQCFIYVTTGVEHKKERVSQRVSKVRTRT